MRQFVAATMPDSEGRILLRGKNALRLCRVLRLTDGDRVDVRLPDGALVPMTLVTGKQAALQTAVRGVAVPSQEKGVPAGEVADSFYCGAEFYLFQCLPKIEKLDIIVRQAVECGVCTVVPVLSAYSPPREAFDRRRERLVRVMREAMEESGSPVATELLDPCTVPEALNWWRERRQRQGTAVLMDEAAAGTVPLHVCVQNAHSGEHSTCSVALAVGAEGGMTVNEKAAFAAAGFVPVHFAVSVLRTETAALYGMAALQATIMEYTSWHVNE